MLIIGLDVGTTGTKAVVIDEEGRILGRGFREYKLSAEAGGVVTQNAEDWWEAAVSAIRTATNDLPDKSAIRGIGLSTQGASMLAVDDKGQPLCPVITWMDSRSSAQAKALAEKSGAETVYRKTGWRGSPGCDAAKIAWIKENQPELFSVAACFVSTLEFINFRLTGRYVIDPSNASIRQMYNINTNEWDGEILSALGITADKLPLVQPTGSLVGRLTPDAAAMLGLSSDVPVFNGAHDQYCASIGCGAVKAGDMLLATGTTWVILGVTDKLLFTDSHIACGIHPVKGKYGALASLVSAGSALNWYKALIDDSFSRIDENAAERAHSAKGLMFYPYLAGAGFPHNNPDMRGTLAGLSLHHDRYDIARALMEGVAFEAKQTLEEFFAQGLDIRRLIMTGGAAKSRLWSEIVGYVTGCEIFRAKEAEACSVGAAMIAAVGLNLFSGYEECASRMARPEPLSLPDPDMRAFYEEKYARYRERLALIMK